MAARRMFDKGVIMTDAFLDMPAGAKCLYFMLNMSADDDGFVSSPKAVMRQCGAVEDDLKLLISKRYLLAFPSGVVVIKHWRMHNTIRTDRYTPTTYIEEKNSITLDDKKAYIEVETVPKPLGNQTATKWQPNGNQTVPQVRSDQVRSDQVRSKDVEVEDPSAVVVQLSTGDLYPISSKRIAELQKVFTEVDVRKELAVMADAMHSNPAKRRTIVKIDSTINNWLQICRERAIGQDKIAKAKAASKPKEKKNAFHNFEQHDYDFAAIERALDMA